MTVSDAPCPNITDPTSDRQRVLGASLNRGGGGGGVEALCV